MRIRGFESSLMEKPYEFAPVALARLCCNTEVSNALASVMAIEDAFKISVPKEAIILRKIVNLGEIIEGNAIKLRPFRDTERLIEIGEKIKSIAGKKAKYIVVGGVSKNISEKRKEKLKELAKEGLSYISREFIEMVNERKKKIPLPDLNLVSANSFSIEDVEVNGFPKNALFYKRAVYSGALSRMYEKGVMNSKNTWDILIARELEMEMALKEVFELLNKLTLTHPYIEPIVNDGKGKSIVESPEGLIYHEVVIKNGKIDDYTIINGEHFNKVVLDGIEENKEEVERIFGFCERCYYL